MFLMNLSIGCHCLIESTKVWILRADGQMREIRNAVQSKLVAG